MCFSKERRKEQTYELKSNNDSDDDNEDNKNEGNNNEYTKQKQQLWTK